MNTDLSEIELARVQGKQNERTHIRRMMAFPIETLEALKEQSFKDGTAYGAVLGGVIAQLQICVKA